MSAPELLRAISGLPDEALVPVGWIRGRLGARGEVEVDLTVEQVAAELSRAPSTVRGWLGAGELAGYKLRGREWRVPRASLRAFLDREANGSERSTESSARAGAIALDAWREELSDA